MPRPFLTASAVAGLATLACAPAALAKGDVTATLSAPTTCAAAAGSTITVAFTLKSDDGQAFGAADVFVRAVRRAGAPSARKEARSLGAGTGRYTARVKVPRGGIRRIDVGIMGAVSGPGMETHASPHYFRVVGDPCRRAR